MHSLMQREREQQKEEQRLCEQELTATAGGSGTSCDELGRPDGHREHGDREKLSEGRRARSERAGEQENQVSGDMRGEDVPQLQEADHVDQSSDGAEEEEEPGIGVLERATAHRSPRLGGAQHRAVLQAAHLHQTGRL